MVLTVISMFYSFADYHIVPHTKHCDMHNENMAERNWICVSLWCPHAENLEVRERAFVVLKHA